MASHEVSDAVAATSHAAARATRAWLTARGLVTIVVELSAEGLPPPPGSLSAAIDAVDVHSLRATTAADVMARNADRAVDDGLRDAARSAVDNAADAAATTELWLRRLAQLCLGVSAHATDLEAAARVDRAVLAQLAGDPHGSGPSLVDDGVWTVATDDLDDLGIELAGMLGRMVVEVPSTLVVRAGDGASLDATVDGDGGLVLRLADGHGLDAPALADLGWVANGEGDGGGASAGFESPVVLLEPVDLVLSTLEALGLRPGDLTLELAVV